MKKKAVFILTAALVFMSAGCGNDGTRTNVVSNTQTVEQVLAEQTAEQIPAQMSQSAPGDTIIPADGNEGTVDVSQFRQGAQADAPEELSDEARKAMVNSTEGIDVDLTGPSSTMIYSEVFDMMNQPGEYAGKTVRMKRFYMYYQDPETKKEYYSCLIPDATACCAQGIEFVPTADYAYPQDYPEEGQEIMVTGTFDTYDEDGIIYYTLRNAEMVI